MLAAYTLSGVPPHVNLYYVANLVPPTISGSVMEQLSVLGGTYFGTKHRGRSSLPYLPCHCHYHYHNQNQKYSGTLLGQYLPLAPSQHTLPLLLVSFLELFLIPSDLLPESVIKSHVSHLDTVQTPPFLPPAQKLHTHTAIQNTGYSNIPPFLSLPSFLLPFSSLPALPLSFLPCLCEVGGSRTRDEGQPLPSSACTRVTRRHTDYLTA